MNFLKLGLNQWKNPDYTVRLEYARRSNNQKKLLYLALNDVHDSVRLAAVKNIDTDELRLQVIEFSSCDQSLELAQRFLESDSAQCEVAAMSSLPSQLRLAAIQKVLDPPESLLVELASDQDDELALYAITRCEDVGTLESLYSESDGDRRCLAILEKVQSHCLALRIFETSEVRARRTAALAKLTDLDKLKELYLIEHDRDVRAEIIQRFEGDSVLIDFFEDEDDELLRGQLAGRVSDQAWLASTAKSDYNLEVRRSAVQALSEQAYLIEVALTNNDEAVHELIFSKQLEDETLVEIAMRSSSSRSRVKAISRISEPSQLESIFRESTFPDSHWFAGRRLGRLPIQSLGQIQATDVLLRAALEDSNKLARVAAIRQIKETWAKNKLLNSEDSEIAEIAHFVFREVLTPSGLRFLQVPNRAYQLSIFPVTCEQFSLWKKSLGLQEEADRYAALADLPVTDVSIEEARQFCDWLGTQDHGDYRLPYFDEWLHAALCDSPDWFAPGRLRAFADSEESELVLFGQDRCARPMHEAVPNPWGLLDIIGSVMEWGNDSAISEQFVSASIPLDEFAQVDSHSAEEVSPGDYACAMGNHWADRRIRTGRWKRLIHKANVQGQAAGKIGFRVLRYDPDLRSLPLEYELSLLPDVAVGYSREQVCYALSRSLLLDVEDVRQRYAVAPFKITSARDYRTILQLKKSWESCGALTKLVSKNI